MMCCIYVQLVDEWLTAMLVESLLSYILYAGCHFGAKNWLGCKQENTVLLQLQNYTPNLVVNRSKTDQRE